MLIAQDQMRSHRTQGPWRTLQRVAQDACAYARTHGGQFFAPRLGGGTRLMLALEHRLSDDVDLFVDSPGWLPYLSPRVNEGLLERVTAYREDSDHVKLFLPGGEVDFIVAGSLLNDTCLWNPDAEEALFPMEPPMEVLAKKLYFRGWALTPRDLFDWASLERIAPEGAIPTASLARLLAPRLDTLESAVRRLQAGHASIAVAWAGIRTPCPLDLADTAAWALGRIEAFRELGVRRLRGPRRGARRSCESS